MNDKLVSAAQPLIKFKHLRNFQYKLDTQGVTQGVTRSVDNLGGVTLAFKVDGDNGDVLVGAAVCSAKENFCYAIGREYAIKRLESNPVRLTRDEIQTIVCERELDELDWKVLDKALGKLDFRKALTFL